MNKKLLKLAVNGKQKIDGLSIKIRNNITATDRGDGNVDILIGVIIAIVVGSLLLIFFKDTFTNTILPIVSSKLQDMFK